MTTVLSIKVSEEDVVCIRDYVLKNVITNSRGNLATLNESCRCIIGNWCEDYRLKNRSAIQLCDEGMYHGGNLE